jgi:hypothetical protein
MEPIKPSRYKQATACSFAHSPVLGQAVTRPSGVVDILTLYDSVARVPVGQSLITRYNHILYLILPTAVLSRSYRG